MMNWPEYEEEEKASRVTITPYALLAVLIVLVGIILWPLYVHAEPRFQVASKDITITLFDDACELKEQITNLPFKAVWVEGPKTFKGCWGVASDVEAVLFYFDDKTTGAIPISAVKKVTAI